MSKYSHRDRVSSAAIALLQKRRESIGMSMNRLAERSGLSLTMISFVERGLRKPTMDTLLRISEALDVELWKVLKKATEETNR